jgi:capsular polysaccharide biosynthesis protein
MTVSHPMSVESPADAPDSRVWRGARRRPPTRRSHIVAATLAAAGVLAALLSGIQAWPTTYAATAIVSFTPKPDAAASAEVMQVIGQKYVVIATSGATLQTAAGLVGTDADTLAGSTTATLSAGTGNVTIMVELPDRGQAVRAANTVAQLVVERSSPDALTAAEVTSAALASRARAKPPRALLSAVSVAAAVLLGFLLWFVLNGRAKRDYARQATEFSEL